MFEVPAYYLWDLLSLSVLTSFTLLSALLSVSHATMDLIRASSTVRELMALFPDYKHR